jgi:serine/threonine-protein kinase
MVKVTDWGIAKAREATMATATQVIKGKPAYMSPEQAKAQPLDGRSDLWALGVMMFEMLCLQQLFAGDSLEATLSQLWFADIPSVRDVRSDVPEDLSRIVASLLVRDPEQRLRSAAVAIEALLACKDYPRNGRDDLIVELLQRFAGRAPVRARHVSLVSPGEATVTLRPQTPMVRNWRTATVPSHIQQRVRSNRRVAWLAAATVLGLGGAVGTFLAARASDRSAAEPTRDVAVEPLKPPSPTAAATLPEAPKLPGPTTVVATPAPPVLQVHGAVVPTSSEPTSDGPHAGQIASPRPASLRATHETTPPATSPPPRAASRTTPKGIREISLGD